MYELEKNMMLNIVRFLFLLKMTCERSLSVNMISFQIHLRMIFVEGVFQVKMPKSYIQEHLKPSELNEKKLTFEVQADIRYPDLIRIQFQSRHSNMKTYYTTVRFDSEEQTIKAWYCTYSTGFRRLGCCTHICALLWHSGVNRAQIPQSHPLSVSHLLDFVEVSDIYSKFDEPDDDDNEVLLYVR